MKEARLAPKPISAFDTTRLASWQRVQGGQCMSIPPEGSPFTTPAPMAEIDCLYDAARLHFEHHQWPDAGQLFRQVWERFPGADASIYAAQLYLESLNLMAHATEPPRPVCYDVMTRDVERIACLYCQPGTTAMEQCAILQRIRFELPFRDSGKMPFGESDVVCPEGQRFVAGECRPLPPLTPEECP